MAETISIIISTKEAFADPQGFRRYLTRNCDDIAPPVHNSVRYEFYLTQENGYRPHLDLNEVGLVVIQDCMVWLHHREKWGKILRMLERGIYLFGSRDMCRGLHFRDIMYTTSHKEELVEYCTPFDEHKTIGLEGDVLCKRMSDHMEYMRSHS